jgi:hypothetical protein
VVAGLTLLIWERSPDFRNATRPDLASAPSPAAPVPREMPPADVASPRPSAPLLARSPEAPSSPARRSSVRTAREPAPTGTASPTPREPVPATPSAPEARPVPPLPDARPAAPPARQAPPTAPATPPASAVAPPSAASSVAVAQPLEASGGPGRASEAKVSATTAPAPEASSEQQVRPAPAPRPSVAPGSSAAGLDRSELRARAKTDAVRRILGSASSPAAGRLTVKDRDAAAAGVTDLLSRVGGHEIARRRDDADTVIDVQLPAARYDEFVRGLDALGAWTPGGPPNVLSQDPPQVRLTIRLGG